MEQYELHGAIPKNCVIAPVLVRRRSFCISTIKNLRFRGLTQTNSKFVIVAAENIHYA